MTAPGSPRQLIKLLPIAFVPSRHAIPLYGSFCFLDAQGARKVLGPFVDIPGTGKYYHSPGYSYTAQSSRQVIFLACCFKHVTGQMVS